MGMTRDEAFKILQLHPGADKEEIRQSYKKLALQWHPDKHENSSEATKKFQEISCAYKKLSADNDDEEEGFTAEFDMFELFKMMFFANGGFFTFDEFDSPIDIDDHEMYAADDDYSGSDYFDDDDYIDDDDDDDFANAANRLHVNYQYRWGGHHNHRGCSHEMFNQRSEEEARRNADELLRQEESEKKEAQRKEEKRKAKNKRKKEAKKKKKKNKAAEVPAGSSTTKPPSATTSKSPSNSIPAKKEAAKKEVAKKEPVKKEESNTTKPAEEQNEHEEEIIDNDDDEVGEWVLSSAFVRGRKGAKANSMAESSKAAAAGSARNSSGAGMMTVGQASSATATSEANQGEVSSNVGQARSYAMRGNEMAQLGHYQAAVDLYSEAIKLHAGDQRYYGNRSFCFERLHQHHSALNDADTAIKLSPEWPKGYFRRGRALSGLKRWKEAEESFEFVLALDPSCSDALVEMRAVQARQLQEMGFSHNQAVIALNRCKTVSASLEVLLSGAIADEMYEETYVSDDDFSAPPQPPAGPLRPEQLQLPDPDCGVCSLWVGSVNPSMVGQKDLEQLFGRYGVVTSVKILPSRKCAFVNFLDSRSTAAAMEALQGYYIGNSNLVLRYPNSATSGASEKKRSAFGGGAQTVNGDTRWGTGAGSETTVADSGWGIPPPATSSSGWNDGGTGWTPSAAPASAVPPTSRTRGGLGSGDHGGVRSAPKARAAQAATRHLAANTYGAEECVYWRAKGCAFGGKCRKVHIPEHKGIDLKTLSRSRR